MLKVRLLLLGILLSGCAYNPYQDPNIDWTGVEHLLVPLEERKPADIGRMCLWDVT